MRDALSNYRADFTARIGRCTTCMRQSLTAALLAWAAFAAVLAAGAGGLAQGLTGVAALALTGLWLLHVATYAGRAVFPAAAPAGRDAVQTGRRRALGTLLKAAGAGALASVPLVLWPSASFAFCGQCTKNADCGVGFVCRNTAPVNSGKVCNECVRG